MLGLFVYSFYNISHDRAKEFHNFSLLGSESRQRGSIFVFYERIVEYLGDRSKI